MEPSQQNSLTLKDKFFEDSLRDVARQVEDTLETLLPPPTTRLQEAMRYSVLGGGKRLRAFLVWGSSQLFNVPSPLALKVAAAVECTQAYSLVHDDLPCMDDADLRRGKPSCHKAFGEATATLVGDALIPFSFQTLAALETSPEIRLELIRELGHTIGHQGLVGGQMMDLGLEGPCQTPGDLLEQQRLKTGVFFAFAAEAGAILGGASPEERRALRTYGLLFGQAFQMMDDWLDGFGIEQATGKPCGQDAEKITFLSLLGSSVLYEKVEQVGLDAIAALAPFQEKALLLEKVALYNLSRVR